MGISLLLVYAFVTNLAAAKTLGEPETAVPQGPALVVFYTDN